MEKFASIHRANRWQNRDSHLARLTPEPRAHALRLPVLQMRATFAFPCAVALDTDLCTTLCLTHNRVLGLTSGYGNEEASSKRTTPVVVQTIICLVRSC